MGELGNCEDCDGSCLDGIEAAVKAAGVELFPRGIKLFDLRCGIVAAICNGEIEIPTAVDVLRSCNES